jgi:hypothetical protein
MKLYKKLAELKKEVGAISKDETNPFFKSKYFDINGLIEHLEPLFEKNGLLLLQPIKNNKVSTQIIDVETGEMIESVLDFELKTDPQKVGSEITYYRRYTLQSLLGIRAEDDDANKASGNNVGKTAIKADPEDDKKWINIGDAAWVKAVGKKLPLSEVRNYYKVSKANAEQYELEIK